MRSFHKIPKHSRTLNIEKLTGLISDETRQRTAAKKSLVPVIDLNRFGITKLMGKGRFPSSPIIVKCKGVTHLAEKKIKKAGGAIVLTA